MTRYLATDGTQAAVGFEQDVDAVRISLSLPGAAELAVRARTAPSLSAWRIAYFQKLVLDDPELSAVCNWFQRNWLQQMMLAALIESSVARHSDLPAALEGLLADGLRARLRDVANRILSMELDAVTEDDEEPPTETDDATHGEQLDQRWEDLISNDNVANRLATLAPGTVGCRPGRLGAVAENPDPRDTGRGPTYCRIRGGSNSRGGRLIIAGP